jgi:hypothetical protein
MIIRYNHTAIKIKTPLSKLKGRLSLFGSSLPLACWESGGLERLDLSSSRIRLSLLPIEIYSILVYGRRYIASSSLGWWSSMLDSSIRKLEQWI